jgi:hypothetical protein
MCLTGAFVIPLIMQPQLAVAVAAQPAVPLSWRYLVCGRGGQAKRRALNVADADIEAARARLGAGEVRLLAVRCAADRHCPPDKLVRLQEAFPSGLTVKTYGAADSRNRLGQRPHATYTKEFRLASEAEADHPARRAFDDLLQFLRDGLGARQA